MRMLIDEGEPIDNEPRPWPGTSKYMLDRMKKQERIEFDAWYEQQKDKT